MKVDSQSLVRNLERMVWMLDEPLGDPAPLNVLYISELAKQNGIKVLLSGAGGDDVFTGYRRHQAIIYDKKLQRLPKSILSSLEQLSGKLDKRITPFRRLAKLFNGSSLDGDQRIINYFKWMDRQDLQYLYSEEFKAEIFTDLAEQPMLDFLQSAHESSSNLDFIDATTCGFSADTSSRSPGSVAKFHKQGLSGVHGLEQSHKSTTLVTT